MSEIREPWQTPEQYKACGDSAHAKSNGPLGRRCIPCALYELDDLRNRTPAPKVDMGPGGLSEEDLFSIRAIEIYENNDATADLDEHAKRAVALVRRLLSSTPPDPSREAREAVIEEVAAERHRQKSVEGWTPGHDDEHEDGELAFGAAAYAIAGQSAKNAVDSQAKRAYSLWPWSASWWKPTTHRRNLIKAAALIVAEIERIDRLAALDQEKPK